MSSGQSERNGSSVEPGLPKTFLIPNARSSAKVASLTVTDLLVDLRDDDMCLYRHCEEHSDEAIQLSCCGEGKLDCFASLAMTAGRELPTSLPPSWSAGPRSPRSTTPSPRRFRLR